jgi:RNA-binding protein 5/10
MPVSACFANPAAFVPTPSGPLGSEFVIPASRLGGIGSDTIDETDGKTVTYWHPTGGGKETISRGAMPVPESGSYEVSDQMRTFLGRYGGVPPKAPTEIVNISMTGMQPIQPMKHGKGKRKAEEEAIIPLSGKNLLEEEEEVDLIGKDSVLLSRSKSAHMQS